MSSPCIFCQIVNGKIPAEKIYEDNNTLAFLDINPLCRGHVLVIPKKHYENIFDLPSKELINLSTMLFMTSPVLVYFKLTYMR